MTAAITLAATTALIVPGTDTPKAEDVKDYMENAYDRYIYSADPSLPSPPDGCTQADNCLQGITTRRLFGR